MAADTSLDGEAQSWQYSPADSPVQQAMSDAQNPVVSPEDAAQSEIAAINYDPAQARAQAQQQAQQNKATQASYRVTAQDLSRRGIGYYTDLGTGAPTPAMDESGAPLTNFDRKTQTGWDSTGNPRKLTFDAQTGEPTLKDPYEGAPQTTDKSGNVYTAPTGLPWRFAGTNPQIQQQNQDTARAKLDQQTQTALTGPVAIAKSKFQQMQGAVDQSEKSTAATLQSLGVNTADEKGQPLDLTNTDPNQLRTHVANSFQSELADSAANEKGLFSSGLTQSAQALRQDIGNRQKQAQDALENHFGVVSAMQQAGTDYDQARAPLAAIQVSKIERLNEARTQAGLQPVVIPQELQRIAAIAPTPIPGVGHDPNAPQGPQAMPGIGSVAPAQTTGQHIADPTKPQSWNQMQAQSTADATAVGLPSIPVNPSEGPMRTRLMDAIQRAQASGYNVPHFIGQQNEPEGDRAPTMDQESLVKALQQKQADQAKTGDQQGAQVTAKELGYWQNEITKNGMSADQWKKGTGENDPDYPAQPTGPAPEGVIGSLLRPIASGIVPALGTAVGGIGGGALAGTAGLPSGPGAIAAAIAGDVAGGALGGGLAQRAQNAVMGGDWTKENEAQMQANLAAHPVASKIGSFIPAILSMLGGGGGKAIRGATDAAGALIPGAEQQIKTAVGGWLGRTAEQTATNPTYLQKTIASLPEMMTLGARMNASAAASQDVNAHQSFANVLPEAIKGAVTMGPTAFIPAASTLLGALLGKPVGDATILATSNALYDHFAKGTPIDPKELVQGVATDIPGFVIMSVLGSLTHGKAPEIPKSSEPPPEAKAPRALPAPTPSGQTQEFSTRQEADDWVANNGQGQNTTIISSGGKYTARINPTAPDLSGATFTASNPNPLPEKRLNVTGEPVDVTQRVVNDTNAPAESAPHTPASEIEQPTQTSAQPESKTQVSDAEVAAHLSPEHQEAFKQNGPVAVPPEEWNRAVESAKNAPANPVEPAPEKAPSGQAEEPAPMPSIPQYGDPRNELHPEPTSQQRDEVNQHLQTPEAKEAIGKLQSLSGVELTNEGIGRSFETDPDSGKTTINRTALANHLSRLDTPEAKQHYVLHGLDEEFKHQGSLKALTPEEAQAVGKGLTPKEREATETHYHNGERRPLSDFAAGHEAIRMFMQVAEKGTTTEASALFTNKAKTDPTFREKIQKVLDYIKNLAGNKGAMSERLRDGIERTQRVLDQYENGVPNIEPFEPSPPAEKAPQERTAADEPTAVKPNEAQTTLPPEPKAQRSGMEASSGIGPSVDKTAEVGKHAWGEFDKSHIGNQIETRDGGKGKLVAVGKMASAYERERPGGATVAKQTNENIRLADNAVSPFDAGQKVRLGKSPQLHTILEELPRQKGDLPDERYFNVKNDRTGGVERNVRDVDMTPVKERSAEDKATAEVTKAATAKEIDSKLRKLGMNPDLIESKDKRGVLRRAEAKERGKLGAANPMLEDNENQARWMDREAQARGFDSLGDMVQNGGEAFGQLAKQWRALHHRAGGNYLNDDESKAINKKLYGPSKSGETSQNALGDAEAALRGKDGTGAAFEADSRKEQRQQLVDWAKSKGLLLSKFPFKLGSESDKGGLEHHAFATDGRWVKATRGIGEKFGFSPSDMGLKPQSALQYLSRLNLGNEVFGDDVRLHGVWEDKHGNVSIITSQPDISGNAIDRSKIDDHMAQSGFEALGDSNYYRPKDNLLVGDLHPGNAVEKDGAIIPFDASAQHPSQELLDAMRKKEPLGAATPDRIPGIDKEEEGMPGIPKLGEERIRMKLNPDETKYVKSLWNNDANLQELLEAIPSARFDGDKLTFKSKDQEGALNFLEESHRLERSAGGGGGITKQGIGRFGRPDKIETQSLGATSPENGQPPKKEGEEQRPSPAPPSHPESGETSVQDSGAAKDGKTPAERLIRQADEAGVSYSLETLKGMIRNDPAIMDRVRKQLREKGQEPLGAASPIQKTKDLISKYTPGLETIKNSLDGIKSLLLPTSLSPEHLDEATMLSARMGEMHRRQEADIHANRDAQKAFDKAGAGNEKVPVTDNVGMKAMSDMSQGRPLDPKFKGIDKQIKAQFDHRLDLMDKADVPLEKLRENYFPGMWTEASRNAFNRAFDEAKQAGKIPANFDINNAPKALKDEIRTRAEELMKGGDVGPQKFDAVSYLAKKPMEGKASFRKEKVFDDVMTGAEFGLKPDFTNPVDMANLKLAEMDKFILAHQHFGDLEKQGKLINMGLNQQPLKKGFALPAGFDASQWAKIPDKYGDIYTRDPDTHALIKVGERWVTKPVHDVLSNYLSSSLYNNRYFGPMYKSWMGMANILNQSQLGVGSAFHAGFTAMEAQTNAVANVMKDVFGVLRGNRSAAQLGKSFKQMLTAVPETVMTGDKILNAYRNPNATVDPMIAKVARAVELAGGGFKMEKGFTTEQSALARRDWFGGNKLRAIARSPVAAIEMMAKPIMESLVPRQKAGVFAHMASRIIEQNPGKPIDELAPQFREAWNYVDAALGQVRYDRLFANNTAKNVVQALVRAPGWSGGTIAQLMGGATDAGKFVKEWMQTGKIPKDLPPRTAYTLALAMTGAVLNGALTYAFTKQQPKGNDFIAFRSGKKDENGNDERFMLPSYLKDMWSYSQHPGQTLMNKTHPLVSMVSQLAQNKDYYGTEIRNPDSGSVGQAGQTGKFVLSQFEPFWVRGMQKEQERQSGTLEKAAPLIGITPAPKEMNQTKAERLAAEINHQRAPALPSTEQQAERRVARSQATIALRQGDTSVLQKELQQGKLRPADVRSIQQKATTDPLVYQVKSLPLEQAERVYRVADPAEKAKLNPIMMQKRARTGKSFTFQ